ncbi:uncharacterized protein [Apostichopus japonicus]|uniref:uncharacterized protein n=1 Tax=Stichopus japonicus TaxID=307972 RepID=UPI003AB5F329
MENLHLIISLLRKGIWAATVDLKDAYLHIPMNREHRRFVAFQYADRDYLFRALPFGLSTAPRAFTRVAGATVSFLRRREVVLYVYLDDWLIVGNSRSETADVFKMERIDAVVCTTNYILSHHFSPYLAPSPRTYSKHGRHRQPLQVAHAPSAVTPSEVPRPQRSAHDHTDQQVGRSHPTPTVVGHTGALEPGSSLHLQPQPQPTPRSQDGAPTGATWSVRERSFHINILEMLAVKQALEAFNTRVTTTVVAYINRQVGTKSEKLCRLAWDNVMADALSRGQLDPNEWTLSQQTCDRIFHRFGKPLTDLFARWDNNRLPTFCSRGFHPQAFHIDAMSLSWDGLDAFLFLPLCMLNQVRRKSGPPGAGSS